MEYNFYKEYVDKAIKDGKETIHRYANGGAYIFIKELDGWISVIDITNPIYKPVIQSKDIKHAESYINMIEKVNVPLKII